MAETKAQLVDRLKAAGIEHDPKAPKAELEGLLRKAFVDGVTGHMGRKRRRTVKSVGLGARIQQP